MIRTEVAVQRAVAKVKEMLGSAWEPIADRVAHQIAAQSVIAAKLRAEPGLASKPEHQEIRRRNVEALANNINFYQPISLELARQAAQAAWTILEASAP